MSVVCGPKGKYWGEIDEATKTYHTTRTNQHYCLKYNGFGLQKTLFDRLRERGVQMVHVRFNGKIYGASMTKWKNHGVVDTLRAEDGAQIFLALSEMTDIDAIREVKRLEEFW